MKKATFIFTADWHLTENQPVCRLDNYLETMLFKIHFVSELQMRHNCPVIHTGDLFDNWKPSPNLLRLAIEHLPKQFFTVYGQHDLPQHNIDLSPKCGIDVLLASQNLIVLDECHWNQKPNKGSLYIPENQESLLVWHVFNYTGRIPWPGCTSPSALQLLRKYPQFKIIATGDNHKSFAINHEGRWLVNPGSLMRMDADQINHRPSVYLYYAESNEMIRVEIPHDPNVISREHIDNKQQRENRINAFISRINTNWKSGVSFRANLEEFQQTNNIRNSVMNIVYKSIEPIKTKKS